MKNIDLWHGDCLKLMCNILDKVVDMILCDLPYGALNKQNKNAHWDCPIDLQRLWKEYSRIIKDNGVIVLFGNGMFTADLMKSNSNLWRYNLVWDKSAKTGFLNANKMPLRQHEDIIVFYKELPVYNPQMTKCDASRRNHSKGNVLNSFRNNCYGNFAGMQSVISDEKYPTSIISIPKEHCNGKFFHPNQKPVKLLELLIKTYTDEGELILDNTMGSGSRGVAGLNTNRRFIGIELEKK